ncbi:MAG: ECF transporter S component [Chloroflexota bacterium]|nr:ECF transporter S component [Chloroflexota bacterium]
MSQLIFALANLLGLAGFLYPLILPTLARSNTTPPAPLLFFLLTTLCLLVVISELTARELDARTVALMGVLSAVNAALRLAETTFLVLPGGISPVFFLIILGGYLFGGRFGFLFGALSLLASALVTGGWGPWLPYQMTAAGWVGLGAGWLPHLEQHRYRRLLLSGYGILCGLLFGFLLNLYFWPFIAEGGSGWQTGLTLGAIARRYLAFYVTTSLWWDTLRAAGNAALLGWLGEPVLKVLGRFQRRTVVEYVESK